MTAKQWTWTHVGENGEQLFECEGKYYTEFAWQHFLEAYKGSVRHVCYNGVINVDFYSDGESLWPADEDTLPMGIKPQKP